ncbi:hypothetical protein Tco_0134831 [Tanacetum coccineum]
MEISSIRRIQRRPIRRIGDIVCEYSGRYQIWSMLQETPICRIQYLGYVVKMDDPNITIEEYIRLEEEKSRRRGKVYNWETAKYDETSLSECDEEEQNVLNFNDLFPFNVIHPNDSKSDKDNDDDKVHIEHSSGNLFVKPLPDVGAYAQGPNKLLETSHDKSNKIFKAETFIKDLNVNIITWNHLNKGMSFNFLIKNLYVPFGIPFDPKLFYKDGIKLGQV